MICIVNKIVLVGIILHPHCVVLVLHNHPHLHELSATHLYVFLANVHYPPELLRNPQCNFVWVGMDLHNPCPTSYDRSLRHYLH